jgi:hypothetical protein
MSEQPDERESRDAATEAAQNVVDEVTSWEYSAETDTIESCLDDGLREAGVEVDPEQRRRLVEGIDEVKQDEGKGAPQVDSAEPTQGTAGS